MKRWIAVVLMVLAGTALAGKKAGVTMPDRVTVAGQPLVLNGMGLREATLGIDVYVAGLYVQHPTSDPAALIDARQPKQLVLKFVHDVDHEKIVKAWHEGFAKSATVPMSQLRPYIAQLDAWTPSFSEGDTLTFTYVPGSGVTVAVNGVTRGAIADPDFAQSLFAIWLGPRPPSGDLKRGLLRGAPPR
jgi:hypothetical protein